MSCVCFCALCVMRPAAEGGQRLGVLVWDGSGRRLTPKNGEAARYLKRMRTVAVAQVLCGNRFVLLVNHPNLPDPHF